MDGEHVTWKTEPPQALNNGETPHGPNLLMSRSKDRHGTHGKEQSETKLKTRTMTNLGRENARVL